jgi:hypothetical protein
MHRLLAAALLVSSATSVQALEPRIPKADEMARIIVSVQILSENCPGSTVDRARMFQIATRAGVTAADMRPGGRFHDMMVEHGKRLRWLQEMTGGNDCGSLRTNYGPDGNNVPGLATVPPSP